MISTIPNNSTQKQKNSENTKLYPKIINQMQQKSYEKLDEKVIDHGTAGGTIGEHTVKEAFDLYEMLSANSQQKSARKMRRGGG